MACFIVPPHILRHMAKSPLPHVQQAGIHSLAVSQHLRGRRSILSLLPVLQAQPGHEYRVMYDCRHRERLPGKLVLKEGGHVPGDLEVKEAYAGADATYQLYYNAFGRNGIDGHGMRMVSSVHYSNLYDNAFWDGGQMVYGDGDGQVFNRFTIAVDVMGHEMSHGVTQYTLALNYEGQSGALNESLSDVFGSMVKQYALGQTVDQADWLIGAGLLAPRVNGRALRDMANPGTAYDDVSLGKDPQPKDMNGYQDTFEDNGGVHINSSIPSRAFYLAAKAMGGKSWEGPGKAWYQVSSQRMVGKDATFIEYAQATLLAASQIWGSRSPQQNSILLAWQTVGVLT